MLLKILYALWPFLKEIISGESDLSKAIRRNKLSSLLFLVNVSLFVLLIYMTDHLINKQKDTQITQQKIHELNAEIEKLKEQKSKLTPPQPVVKAVPPKPLYRAPVKQVPEEPVPPIDINSRLDAIRREDY